MLAVKIAEFIKCKMGFEIDFPDFYTDSKIVLRYIYNQIRQFYAYVNSRVQHITKFSTPIVGLLGTLKEVVPLQPSRL